MPGIVTIFPPALALLLAGCVAQAQRGPQTVAAPAAAACQTALADSRIDPVRGRIPVQAIDLNDVPSMAMLTDTGRPDAAQREAARVLEEAIRTCRERYRLAGYHTGAFEDVRDLRISDIRARLHRGEIGFGTYNNRYVEILTAYADQQSRAANAYAQGVSAGNAAFYQQLQTVQLQQQTLQMQSMQNELSNIRSQQFNSQYRVWNCHANGVGNTTFVNCY
jgi:hypothetical protein